MGLGQVIVVVYLSLLAENPLSISVLLRYHWILASKGPSIKHAKLEDTVCSPNRVRPTGVEARDGD